MTPASDLKGKLLAALADTSLEAVETGRLLDVLLDKVRRLEADNVRLRGENGRERQQLHDAQEKIHLDMHRLLSDPLFGAHGMFCFSGIDQQKVMIEVQGGEFLSVFIRKGEIDYVCQREPMP